MQRVQDLLAALEAPPHVTWELFLREVVEAGLQEQRAEYETMPMGGDDG